MKKALVILVALALSGAVGVSVYKAANSYAPKMIDQVINGDQPVTVSSSSSNTQNPDGDSYDTATELGEQAAKMKAGVENHDSASSVTTLTEHADVAYAPYHEGLIGNGQKAVLFFHAKWCPSCREADIELKSMYAAGSANIPTYKVDYDTEKALEKKYAVTYQHTFVLIDGKGAAVKTLLGATKEQLAALLK